MSQLNFHFDQDDGTWTAASAITATGDDPFHYIIGVIENGQFHCSFSDAELCVHVGPHASLTMAKIACERAEALAMESAESEAPDTH